MKCVCARARTWVLVWCLSYILEVKPIYTTHLFVVFGRIMSYGGSYTRTKRAENKQVPENKKSCIWIGWHKNASYGVGAGRFG